MQNEAISSGELMSVWNQYCERIQKLVSPAVYSTWIVSNPITDITSIDEQSAHVIITSPTAFHSTNLKRNLHIQIKQTLDAILSKSVMIEYEVGDTQKQRPAQHSSFTSTASQFGSMGMPVSEEAVSRASFTPQPSYGMQPPQSHAQAQQPQPYYHQAAPSVSPRVEELFSESTMVNAAEERFQMQARGIGLRTDYTFATFAVSTTNEMAHAAATAVSNRPGQSYNPLFFYGGVGVGKTHLMHAIANNILQANPNSKILYCTGEEFTNEIVHAIQTKKASSFKDRYRTATVLLIDDIQFIAGKNAVQEEFFHTFNALIKNQSQIVLTSDRPPHEITLLEDRLRSRFEAGLMIDIQQPSFELRTAIVLLKAKAQNLSISIDIAKIIASKVESARKIEGVITSIRSEIELKHKELNQELIEELLQVEVTNKRPRIKVSPADVIKTVANHYHVKQAALKGSSRLKSLVTARHVAMFLLKNELQLPLTEIGRWFTGRDHTSVLHAVRKIEKEQVLDETIQQDVSALKTTLTSISR